MKYCTKCERLYSGTQRFCFDDGARLSLQDPYHLVGRTIAEKYRLDALVGIGGMGAVYSAQHLALDRCVALKILQPNIVIGDNRMIVLFEREAKTAAQLTHENIATILDAGRANDNLAYIAMEWLEGRTLEEELIEQGALDLNRVFEILKQVTAGLDAAHDANIVHRDLKPSNIMLTKRPSGREQVKILDFGIAKVVSETTNSPVSAVLGTLHYASPEQLSVGGNIDGRSDLYSLGVVIYEMLTGDLPFKATSVHELARLHLHAPPPPLRNLRSEAPLAIETLIHRLLAKNPKDRPRSAGEIPVLFEKALNDAKTQQVLGSHAVGTFESSYTSAGPSFESQLPGDSSELFSDLNVRRTKPSIELSPDQLGEPSGNQSGNQPGYRAGNSPGAFPNQFAAELPGSARAFQDPAATPPPGWVGVDGAAPAGGMAAGGMAGRVAAGAAWRAAGQAGGGAYSDLFEGDPAAVDGGLRSLLRRRWIITAALGLLAVILVSAVLYRLFWTSKAIDSVAVLPFKNVGADPNVEYLSSGITESLITSLSRLPGLRVIARSSVFRYKPGETDPQTVGRDLNIQAVVAGQVVQRGDGLTVSVELVNAGDGSIIWSEQYQRRRADLPTMQQEITREVAVKLRTQLTDEERNRVEKRYTDDGEIQTLYLLGRHFWNMRTPESLQKGIGYFQQVIAKDPSNALAYSGLADSYFVLGPVGIGALTGRETMPKQKENAIKALELDPQLAEALTSLAVVKLVFDWDWDGAEQTYKRALQLNPNYAIAHNWYATYLTARGRSTEAIISSNHALEIDPLSPNFSNALAGYYYYAHQYDPALAQYLKTIKANPKFAQAHADLARVYERQGKFDDALRELNTAVTLSKRTPKLIASMGYVYARAGRQAEALKLLEELNTLKKRENVASADFALIYLGLNDKDRAFTELRKCLDERATILLYIKVDPIYDPLRSDPRFASILKRIG